MQTEVYGIDIRMEGDAVFDLEGHLGAEVIPQVLSDARELTHDGYPKWLQLVFAELPTSLRESRFLMTYSHH